MKIKIALPAKNTSVVSMLRCGFLLLVLASFAVVVRGQDKQDKKTFPTDDEINLLLTQTDRAMQQYKPLVDQAEKKMGKKAGEAAARDRQVVGAIELAVKALKTNPQGFNGPGGFALFEWLDDADRNALLCASQTASQSTLYMIAGNQDEANDLIHLSQSCLDVSSLIYTVSENAGALFERYVEAEQGLASEGLAAMEKCVAILKKNGPAPK